HSFTVALIGRRSRITQQVVFADVGFREVGTPLLVSQELPDAQSHVGIIVIPDVRQAASKITHTLEVMEADRSRVREVVVLAGDIGGSIIGQGLVGIVGY